MLASDTEVSHTYQQFWPKVLFSSVIRAQQNLFYRLLQTNTKMLYIVTVCLCFTVKGQLQWVCCAPDTVVDRLIAFCMGSSGHRWP